MEIVKIVLGKVNIKISRDLGNENYQLEWIIDCNNDMCMKFFKIGDGKNQFVKDVTKFHGIYSKILPEYVTIDKICNEWDFK